MDSLRLIYFWPRNPSWIWIRYVQHAFHKHHKNVLCRSERHSALDKFPFHLWSTLMETTHASPRNTRHTKLHGDFEYFPHTSNDTLPSLHLAKPFRLKQPTSLNTTSLAAPRTNLLKAANENFRCCVLLKKSLVIHFCCHNTDGFQASSLMTAWVEIFLMPWVE